MGDQIAEALATNRDTLVGDSGGRTEDVSRSVTAVMNSLAEYIAAVVGDAPLSFTVPVDMSLGEAMFLNGIDLANLREVHRANSHVADPFFVAKGTVLSL